MIMLCKAWLHLLLSFVLSPAILGLRLDLQDRNVRQLSVNAIQHHCSIYVSSKLYGNATVNNSCFQLREAPCSIQAPKQISPVNMKISGKVLWNYTPKNDISDATSKTEMYITLLSASSSRKVCLAANNVILQLNTSHIASLSANCLHELGEFSQMEITYYSKSSTQNILYHQNLYLTHASGIEEPMFHYWVKEFQSKLEFHFLPTNPNDYQLKFRLVVWLNQSTTTTKCSSDFGGRVSSIIIPNEDKIYYFDDLKLGYYCFSIELLPNNCPKYVEHLTEYSIMYRISEPQVVGTRNQKAKKRAENVTVIVILLSGLILITAIACFYLKYKKRNPVEKYEEKTNSIAMKDLPVSEGGCDASVFVMFTEDNKGHMKVIECLVNLLRSLGCHVHFMSDSRTQAEILADPAHWIMKQVNQKTFEGRKHKVIWVASQLACQLFEDAFTKQNVINKDNNGSSINLFYKYASQIILHRIFTHEDSSFYSHIAIINFPYHLNNRGYISKVLPDVRYELPKMFNHLLAFLNESSSSNPQKFDMDISRNSSNVYVHKFVEAVEDMMEADNLRKSHDKVCV